MERSLINRNNKEIALMMGYKYITWQEISHNNQDIKTIDLPNKPGWYKPIIMPFGTKMYKYVCRSMYELSFHNDYNYQNIVTNFLIKNGFSISTVHNNNLFYMTIMTKENKLFHKRGEHPIDVCFELFHIIATYINNNENARKDLHINV